MENSINGMAKRLLNIESFHKLHDQLNRFNVFEAFGVISKEVRHNALLHYLLDPQESHGLGDLFLRHFLIQISNDKIADVLFDKDINLYSTIVNSQFKVKTKEGPSLIPDLEISIPIPNKSRILRITVEMKIYSSAGSGQWTNYQNYYNSEDDVLVYLTVSGLENPGDHWINTTYTESIYPAIQRTITATQGRVDPEVLGLLNNYLDIIAKLTDEEDSGLIDLAESVLNDAMIKTPIDWAKLKTISVLRPYWRALEMLEARTAVINESSLLTNFNKWCADSNHIAYQSNESYMRFIPNEFGGDPNFIGANESLAGTVSPGKDWTVPKKAALLFEISRSRKDENGQFSLTCVAVLGPLKDIDLRENLRNKLKVAFNYSRKSSSPTFSKVGLVAKADIDPGNVENCFAKFCGEIQKKIIGHLPITDIKDAIINADTPIR